MKTCIFKSKSLGRKNDKRVVPEGVERSQILIQDQLLIESGLVHKHTPEQEEEAWVVVTRYTGFRLEQTETYEELSQKDFKRKKKKRRRRGLIATIAAVVSAVTAVLTYLGI